MEPCIVLIILLLGHVQGRVWKASVHYMPPFFERVKLTGQMKGIIPELLNAYRGNNTNESFELNLVPVPAFPTGSMSYTNEQMVTCLHNLPENDFCLYSYTTDNLAAAESTDSTQEKVPPILDSVLTIPLLRLKPTFVAWCSGASCPAKMDPKTTKAMYFMRAFHSAVWSLILVYILTAGSLLFMFEYSHPFQLGFHRRSGKPKGAFTLAQAFQYVTLGLLLQGHHKHPRSWAGMVLSLFWFAFCIICVVAYVLGTSRLIFQSLDQIQSSKSTSVMLPVKGTVVCEESSDWCQLLKAERDYEVKFIPRTWTTAEELKDKIGNHSTTFLTDHLTANYLLHHKSNDTQWVTGALSCSSENKGYRLPSLPLGFAVNTPGDSWAFNKHINKLKQSKEFYNVLSKWTDKLPDYQDLCFPTSAEIDSTPIRMEQMNGPLIFMIAGALSAIITHGLQFFYLSFIKTDEERLNTQGSPSSTKLDEERIRIISHQD